MEKKIRKCSHLDKLVGQLKRRGFKSQVARGAGQHKPKVNVQDVALGIEEDVAVVSVFDLHKVAEQRVGSQAFHKVALFGGGVFETKQKKN